LQSRYYDPEMGRFINADSYASTGQGVLGNNMFAYCLNNPANYYDDNGYDAIWIQEGNSAKGQGHSGLMVQDDEGNWFYFYWGPENEDEAINLLISGVANGSYVEEIQTNGADMHDINALQIALSNSGGKASERADLITSIYYFEGDYSATLEAVNAMVASGEKYELLSNNCLQKTIAAFSASDSRFFMVTYGEIVYSLHPNSAAVKVAMLPSRKEAFPWQLVFFNAFG